MSRSVLIAVVLPLVVVAGAGSQSRAGASANGIEIYSVSADGSSPRLLSRLYGWENTGAEWSPDGRRIAFLVGHTGEWKVQQSLYVMHSDGGGKRRLSPGTMAAGRQGDPPSWSPDGSTIVFSAVGPSRTGIWLVHPNGSGLRKLVKGGFEPAWSPDGHWIAYRTISNMRVMRSGGGSSRSLASNAFVPVWSPIGKQLAFTRANRLYVVPLGGGPARLVLRGHGEMGAPSWSPNGKKLAAADWASVYVVQPGRKGTLVLGPGDAPSWSPDGRRIAFLRNSALYTTNPDGTDLRSIWARDGWDVTGLEWSPDGRTLLFTAGPAG